MQMLQELREQLQPFIDSAAAVLMFFLILGALVGLVLWLLHRRKEKDLRAEKDMNPNHFTMWISRGDSGIQIIGILFFGLFMAFVLFADFTLSIESIFVGTFAFAAVLSLVLQAVYWKFWKLRIEGSQIHYQSLFRRRTFSFHEIKSVQGKYRRGQYSRRWLLRVIFYSETGKLFSVKVKSIGYSVLAQRLHQQGIDVYALRTADDIAFEEKDDEDE